MSDQTSLFEGAFSLWAKAFESMASKDGPLSHMMKAMDVRDWPGSPWQSTEGSIESVLGLPRFAFPPIDRKVIALLGGWVMLLQRASEYNSKSAGAWSEAWAEFMAELNKDAAAGKPAHLGRELLERWIAVLGRKMQSVQKSEEFLACQSRLMETVLSSRTREREIVEMISTVFDLPTRSELNDAHRSVHDLKREVRKLRREVDALTAAGRAARAAPDKPASRNAAQAQEIPESETPTKAVQRARNGGRHGTSHSS